MVFMGEASESDVSVDLQAVAPPLACSPFVPPWLMPPDLSPPDLRTSHRFQPITVSMYTLIGTTPEGREREPLTFDTLEALMQRLRDLIEADECEVTAGEAEERGAIMFVRYTVIPKHAPRPQFAPHQPPGPQLRLVR